MTGRKKIIEKVYEISFKVNADKKGSLVAIESKNNLGFAIQRVFYMYGMDTELARGQHANRNSTMCFINVKGSCKIQIDNGSEKETFILNNPAKGIICESMTWKEMYDFSPDCILMVICDTNYDTGEYIHNYSDFKAECIK